MVDHERPAWAPARVSISKRWRSSWTGRPHSSSWYWRYSGSWSPDAQEQRFFSAMDGDCSQPRSPPLRSGGRFGAYAQLGAHLLAHDELLYLAGDSQRELGNEPDMAGNLVLGDLAAAEVADLQVGGDRAGSELQPGADFLSVFLVRYAEYLHRLDFRVPVEELFDLAREDVFAAADQHVFQTARDVAITLCVDDSQVAGMHPTR